MLVSPAALRKGSVIEIGTADDGSALEGTIVNCIYSDVAGAPAWIVEVEELDYMMFVGVGRDVNLRNG
jgi:hypothetical protein